MTTYICILRGINVGGKRKIRMEELREAFNELGFQNVKTYIQSGNIIFSAAPSLTSAEIAESIEKTIRSRFGFEVPVILRTRGEMQQLVDENPFISTENNTFEGLHVTFLKETPAPEAIEVVQTSSYPPDLLEIRQKNVFLYIPGPYHLTKLSNAFFEKKLKVSATTRNWKTVLKLVEISDF